MAEKRIALVAVESEVGSDPRVRRQIRWLTDDGWLVDSVGLGASTPAEVRDHFTLAETSPWKLKRIGTLLIHGFLSNRRKFAVLTLARVPTEVRNRVRSGQYDLIILNDRHFVPWVENPAEFTQKTRLKTHVHLDLHEYFVPTLPRDSLWRIATAPHYEWSRELFGHPLFDSRSTVNSGIAQLYADEFGFPRPAVIRNSPDFESLKPSAVDPKHIRLIHHGSARGDRGIKEMVDALRLLDDRFTATFMLVGSDGEISSLREYAADLGDRVRIVPPAPMERLAREVNKYDLEVMFYAPRTRNLELALPNKLFEAVQGRLGLVVGESPMMAELVRAYGNGVVVIGWEPEDLAAVVQQLTAPQVEAFKQASHAAASELSADQERVAFFAALSDHRRGMP